MTWSEKCADEQRGSVMIFFPDRREPARTVLLSTLKCSLSGTIPEGVFPKKLGRDVRPLPKTLTLFMTKICDFPYPIYKQNLRFSLLYV